MKEYTFKEALAKIGIGPGTMSVIFRQLNIIPIGGPMAKNKMYYDYDIERAIKIKKKIDGRVQDAIAKETKSKAYFDR